MVVQSRSSQWTALASSVSVDVVLHPSCLDGHRAAAGLVDVVGDESSHTPRHILIVVKVAAGPPDTKCPADF